MSKKRGDETQSCNICYEPLNVLSNCCFHIVENNISKLPTKPKNLEEAQEVVIQKLNSNELTIEDLLKDAIIHVFHLTCVKRMVNSNCPNRCESVKWICVNYLGKYDVGFAEMSRPRGQKYIERSNEFPYYTDDREANTESSFIYPNENRYDNDNEIYKIITGTEMPEDKTNVIKDVYRALKDNPNLLKITSDDPEYNIFKITGIEQNDTFTFFPGIMSLYNFLNNMFLPNSEFNNIIKKVAFEKNRRFWCKVDTSIKASLNLPEEKEGCSIMGGRRKSSRKKMKSRQRKSSRKGSRSRH